MKRFLLCALLAAMLGGCARTGIPYNREGMIVNNQRSYYVNEPLWVVLSMPGDFLYQPKDTGNGARIGHGFREDKAVYRQLGIDPKKVTVLYSATPVKPPAYHLMALLYKDSSGITTGFLRKYTHADPSYFYRKVEGSRREIYQALLPYNNTYIGLIYYAPANTDCHYCDIENIATYNYGWLAKNKAGAKDTTLRQVALDLPADSLVPDEMGVMLVHRLDTATGKISYQTFVPMAADNNHFEINLHQGRYEFKYMDRQQQIRWSTKMNVE